MEEEMRSPKIQEAFDAIQRILGKNTILRRDRAELYEAIELQSDAVIQMVAKRLDIPFNGSDDVHAVVKESLRGDYLHTHDPRRRLKEILEVGITPGDLHDILDLLQHGTVPILRKVCVHLHVHKEDNPTAAVLRERIVETVQSFITSGRPIPAPLPIDRRGLLLGRLPKAPDTRSRGSNGRFTSQERTSVIDMTEQPSGADDPMVLPASPQNSAEHQSFVDQQLPQRLIPEGIRSTTFSSTTKCGNTGGTRQ
ncbi:LOW QUALITY PROTEIN: hypothetical protein BSKO_02423 [Bryopsis sp. KO-2023]|nr:LOW QUALITY PROTEIN: hypothetical protein BSKO_02423 [Bryopsis sp. KO-2023]